MAETCFYLQDSLVITVARRRSLKHRENQDVLCRLSVRLLSQAQVVEASSF
jgi:hypothetical protein